MRLCYREIVTRDNQRKHSAEPMVSIDHNPESRSFHIFYGCCEKILVYAWQRQAPAWRWLTRLPGASFGR